MRPTSPLGWVSPGALSSGCRTSTKPGSSNGERRANPRLPQPCYLSFTEAGSQARRGPDHRGENAQGPADPRPSSVAFKVNREQADLLDRVVKKTVRDTLEVIRAALRHYLPELEEAPKAS